MISSALRRAGLAAAVILLASGPAAVSARAGTVLTRVKAAGTLKCAALMPPDDWGKEDVHGALPAFDGDLCRAIAAAVLDSPDRVSLIEVPSERTGFAALASGKADVFVGASPSQASAVAFGVAFARPIFLDGDGLLVHQGSGIKGFDDLGGKAVCYVPGTPDADVLESEAMRRRVALVRWPFEEHGELLAAVAGRKCDAMFGAVSRLSADRTLFHALSKDFVVLPERFSVVPMAPAVAAGDPEWSEVVDAAVNAPVLAESAGVSRETATSLRATEDPLLRGLSGTLTGIDPSVVAPGWGIRVISAVGNYAEMFDRDLGSGSTLGLPRGPNAPTSSGGWLLAEPAR